MGWSQTFIPEYPDLYPDVARWSVQREGLSTGLKLLFGSVISKPDCLLGVGDRIVTGLQLEPIFGGLFRSGPRDLHNRGFLPDQFESLSPSERLRDAHRSMLSTLESENTALPGNDAQRRWLQDLQQGERYLMGSSLWRLSLAAWPVPMSLHRRLLSVRRALPFAGDSISERRVQRQLVAGRFPDLAAIPFDANAFNWYVLRRTPFTSLREFPLRIRRKIASLRGNEVRYYHRIEGLQHLHWDRLRAMAEPGREALGDLFDPAKLQAFLPGPGHPIPNLANPFSGSAPQRLLLGLMLRTQPDSVWTKSAEPSV